MDHFDYKDGVLCAELVPLPLIAKSVGTPFYCYSTATIERHYRVLSDALSGVPSMLCYSVKANSNIAVIRTLAELGAGADVVSGGELRRALMGGVAADRIVFSGVGKTREEVAQALDAKILQINAESVPELRLINEVAGQRGVKAPIALRINPDIDAKTHTKVATGRREDKFGIAWDLVHEIVNDLGAMTNLQLTGLAMHIGSQLTSLEPFRAAFQRMRDVIAKIESGGAEILSVDLGGGLGIPYDLAIPPGPEDYGAIVEEYFKKTNYKLLFEPGRLIVGNAGVLVTQLLYVKQGANRRFAVVDAAMNDLMRPTLYDARHQIVAVQEPDHGSDSQALYDVVGPVCETGDSFGDAVPLPEVGENDLLAIRSAGAYGAVMASSYNSRPLVPEVLVKGDRFFVVRKRIEVEELIGYEEFPDWFGDGSFRETA